MTQGGPGGPIGNLYHQACHQIENFLPPGQTPRPGPAIAHPATADCFPPNILTDPSLSSKAQLFHTVKKLSTEYSEFWIEAKVSWIESKIIWIEVICIEKTTYLKPNAHF